MQIKLYHKDVYLPEKLIESVYKKESQIREVYYARHFKMQSIDKTDVKHYLSKDIKPIILACCKNPILPFEVETTIDSARFGDKKEHVTKYVFRTHYNEKEDISIVIIPQFSVYNNSEVAFVKTAWLNSITDIHRTLDISKYEQLKK